MSSSGITGGGENRSYGSYPQSLPKDSDRKREGFWKDTRVMLLGTGFTVGVGLALLGIHLLFIDASVGGWRTTLGAITTGVGLGLSFSLRLEWGHPSIQAIRLKRPAAKETRAEANTSRTKTTTIEVFGWFRRRREANAKRDARDAAQAWAPNYL